MTFNLKINLGLLTYFSWSSDFCLLFFALKNVLVLFAKPDSGELCCPVTALIKYYCFL